MSEDGRDLEARISRDAISFLKGNTAYLWQWTALNAPLQGAELRNLLREGAVNLCHEPTSAASACRGNEDTIVAPPDVEWAQVHIVSAEGGDQPLITGVDPAPAFQDRAGSLRRDDYLISQSEDMPIACPKYRNRGMVSKCRRWGRVLHEGRAVYPGRVLHLVKQAKLSQKVGCNITQSVSSHRPIVQGWHCANDPSPRCSVAPTENQQADLGSN